MEKETVKIIEESRVYDGYTKVDEALIAYQTKNGEYSNYKRQKVTRPDAVTGLVYNTDNESVILVKQHRYPIQTEKRSGFIYEAVAGTMEKGEDPKKTFIRECFEEIGYILDEQKVEYCFSAYASPGYSTEKVHYFIATVNKKNKAKGAGGGLKSENENIEVCEINYLIFKGMMDGNIDDAKTKLLAYEAHYRKLFERK
jgi:nudix-type nucleoside diphosphatase (YffH/AdpP family)